MQKGLSRVLAAYSGRPADETDKIVTLAYIEPDHSLYNSSSKTGLLDVEFTKHVDGDYFTIQMTERMENVKGIISARTISCTLRGDDRKRVAQFMLEGALGYGDETPEDSRAMRKVMEGK